jgi:hypothetical protein
MLVSQWLATSHHYRLALMLSSVHWTTIPRSSHLMDVPTAQLEPCGPHKCFLVNNIPVWTLHLASVNVHSGSSLINHLVYCCTLSHVFSIYYLISLVALLLHLLHHNICTSSWQQLPTMMKTALNCHQLCSYNFTKELVLGRNVWRQMKFDVNQSEWEVEQKLEICSCNMWTIAWPKVHHTMCQCFTSITRSSS